VYDRQTNGAFPTIADILYDAPAGATYYGSGLNMTNKSRFSIIRDFRVELDMVLQEGHVFHTFSKCRYETEFGADGGTIGDVRTGAIYLVAFTGTLTGAGVINMRNVMCRIRFYD